jgi:hypothetical protein
LQKGEADAARNPHEWGNDRRECGNANCKCCIDHCESGTDNRECSTHNRECRIGERKTSAVLSIIWIVRSWQCSTHNRACCIDNRERSAVAATTYHVDKLVTYSYLVENTEEAASPAGEFYRRTEPAVLGVLLS